MEQASDFLKVIKKQLHIVWIMIIVPLFTSIMLIEKLITTI